MPIYLSEAHTLYKTQLKIKQMIFKIWFFGNYNENFNSVLIKNWNNYFYNTKILSEFFFPYLKILFT